MRDRTLPTVSPRRTTGLLLASSAVLLVSLIAASLTRISVPSRSLPHLGAAPNAIVRPLVLLPVGTTDDPRLAARTTGLVLVDARSGAILDRHAIADSTEVLSASFVSPGDRIVFYTGEHTGPHARLEVRRLPGWDIESVVPIDASISSARVLAERFPSISASDPTLLAFAAEPQGRWAAVAFWSLITPKPDGPSSQLVWVTMVDLERAVWAGWAYPLPSSQAASLVALPDRILVLGHELRTSSRRSVGTVVALDPQSGEALGQLTLESASTTAKPLGEGPDDEQATFSTALDPVLWNGQLLVVTTDLEAFVIDPSALTVTAHYPPLADRLVAAGRPFITGDRLVVGGGAVRVIDISSWRLLATHPLPQMPETWWIAAGLVVQETLLLTGTREGCLRHLDLATSRLSAPLACGFLVDYPASLFGWPVFYAGSSGP